MCCNELHCRLQYLIVMPGASLAGAKQRLVRKVGQETGLLYLQRLQSAVAPEQSVHSMALSYRTQQRRLAEDALRVVGMSGSQRCCCCCFYSAFSPSLNTLALLGDFSSAYLTSFFLCPKTSTKTVFHLQRSKPSCPVRQTARDTLAVWCETLLKVAKESFLQFSDVEGKKACSMLLRRPWHGCF